MTSIPMNEQECQRDTMQRLHDWLIVLEKRITDLLEETQLQDLKPGEREQAASRYIALMLRLLQYRRQFAETNPSAGAQALLEAILKGENEDI